MLGWEKTNPQPQVNISWSCSGLLHRSCHHDKGEDKSKKQNLEEADQLKIGNRPRDHAKYCPFPVLFGSWICLTCLGSFLTCHEDGSSPQQSPQAISGCLKQMRVEDLFVMWCCSTSDQQGSLQTNRTRVKSMACHRKFPRFPPKAYLKDVPPETTQYQILSIFFFFFDPCDL